MEKLNKIEKAIITLLDWAAYGFLTVMAVIFALVGIIAICTGFDIVNLFGFAGFIGAAFVCWNMRR